MNNFEIITLNKKGVNDFAKERNTLLAKSKAEWVLFLDTDETLTADLKKEIENLNPGEYNGFYIKRKISFLSKEIGEDKVLRLAKRVAGKWQRKVHETWKINGKTGVLQNYIVHNTATNLRDYIDKINFYSTLHASENLREGKRSDMFKIIVYPKIKFIQNIALGRGFTFSMLQSLHSFLSWVKQWELQKK